MGAIVLELQRLASESGSITELLRKALIVARKLGLADFREWIQAELDGYPNSNVPNYRVVAATVEAWNSVRREYVPILFEEAELAQMLSRARVNTPIAGLVSLLDSDSRFFRLPFPPQIEQVLLQMQQPQLSLQPMQHITRASIAAITEAVRNAVLNWSLTLEEQGILGEGMQFSTEEQKAAAHIHIDNFVQLGTMVNSQAQIGTTQSNQGIRRG